MNTKTCQKTATALDAYIKARAKHQGVEYGLDKQFFCDFLKGGIRSFFQVEVDNKGNLSADRKFPEFFRQWRTSNN